MFTSLYTAQRIRYPRQKWFEYVETNVLILWEYLTHFTMYIPNYFDKLMTMQKFDIY
jgi:hypothetical protein